MGDHVTVRVNVDELINVTNLLLNAMKSRGYLNVDLNHSYYWTIEKDERYDPQKDPQNLMLGDLVHYWERMKQILDDQELIVSAAFIWLGSIYRAIGEEVQY